jgi:hypothetical protein
MHRQSSGNYLSNLYDFEQRRKIININKEQMAIKNCKKKEFLVDVQNNVK